MTFLAQASSPDLHGAVKISSVVLGILALYVALKVVKVFLKLLFGLIGFALLGGWVWWVLLRH
jgi:hypothetical protein